MPTRYTLTRDDASLFQARVARRLKRQASLHAATVAVQMACWMFIGMAGAHLMRLVGDYPEMSAPLVVLGVLLVLAFSALLAIPPLQRAIVRRHVVDDRGAFLAPKTLDVSAQGLVIEAVGLRMQVAWSAVLGVEEDAAHHYLFIDALQALVIPKAAVEPFRAEFERRLAFIPRDA